MLRFEASAGAADKAGVHIRLILNRIPTLLLGKSEDVRSPIFIPETVDELDKYIDVFEFDTKILELD